MHGDVKSENVFLVTRDDGGGAAAPAFALGDWGSAAAIGAPPPLTSPCALPPSPSPRASPADDVWAVGALAAELLTGGGVRRDGAGRALLPTHLSREARRVVEAATAREREARPSATELWRGPVRAWVERVTE